MGLSAAKSRISKYVLDEDTVLNRAKKINGCDIEILKNRALFRADTIIIDFTPFRFERLIPIPRKAMFRGY